MLLNESLFVIVIYYDVITSRFRIYKRIQVKKW